MITEPLLVKGPLFEMIISDIPEMRDLAREIVGDKYYTQVTIIDGDKTLYLTTNSFAAFEASNSFFWSLRIRCKKMRDGDRTSNKVK